MLNRMLVVGSTLTALAVADVPALGAQDVSADIHIGGWPVAGTIHIGDRRHHPARRVVVVRERPRVIVVQRDRGRGWHKRGGGFRVVEAWYDRHCGVYFDRYRRGFVGVQLVERDGRYYRYDRRFDDRYDGRYERDRRYDRDRDRYGRYDRYDDDYGSWEHDHEH